MTYHLSKRGTSAAHTAIHLLTAFANVVAIAIATDDVGDCFVLLVFAFALCSFVSKITIKSI